MPRKLADVPSDELGISYRQWKLQQANRIFDEYRIKKAQQRSAEPGPDKIAPKAEAPKQRRLVNR